MFVTRLVDAVPFSYSRHVSDINCKLRTLANFKKLLDYACDHPEFLPILKLALMIYTLPTTSYTKGPWTSFLWWHLWPQFPDRASTSQRTKNPSSGPIISYGSLQPQYPTYWCTHLSPEAQVWWIHDYEQNDTICGCRWYEHTVIHSVAHDMYMHDLFCFRTLSLAHSKHSNLNSEDSPMDLKVMPTIMIYLSSSLPSSLIGVSRNLFCAHQCWNQVNICTVNACARFQARVRIKQRSTYRPSILTKWC